MSGEYPIHFPKSTDALVDGWMMSLMIVHAEMT